MDKFGRDLQTAGIDIPRRSPPGGLAYLPALATATDTILAILGTTQHPPAT